MLVLAYSATKINYWYILNYIFWRPQVSVKEVYFPKADKKLYLKAYQRGLDRKVKIISTSGSKFVDPDEDEDFIQSTQLDIFYKIKDDTLEVYLLSPFQIPKNPPEGIVVRQYPLENPAYMSLYDKWRSDPSCMDMF